MIYARAWMKYTHLYTSVIRTQIFVGIVHVLILARVIGIYLCVRVKEDVRVKQGKRRGYDSSSMP